MKLTKEDKEAIFEGVMSSLGTLVGKMLAEAEEKVSKVDEDGYVLVKDFSGHEDFFVLAKKMHNQDMDYAQVWLGQKVDDNEFDSYVFLFAPKMEKITNIKRTAEKVKTDGAKSAMVKKLSALGLENVKIRDIYVDDDDVKSAISNVDKDDKKFMNALTKAVFGAEAVVEETKKEETQKQESADKQKTAEMITTILKKVSKNDEAFDELADLFVKIETLARKHDSNYLYALKAINMRTNLKKEDDK